MRSQYALSVLRGSSQSARLRVCAAARHDASWAIANAAWGVSSLLMAPCAPLSTIQRCAVQLCI